MKLTTYIIACLYMLIIGCKSSDESESIDEEIEPKTDSAEILLVGTNKNIISPPLDEGIKMSGYSGRTEPFSAIHDNLFVRTVVITDQNDNNTTVHVSSEQLNMGGEIFLEVNERVNAALDIEIPISNMFISATHTHGGPSTTDTTHGPTVLYKQERTDKIVQSIIDAYDNRKEARVRIGTSSAFDVNTNRQLVESGVCDLEVNPEGNSDKEFQFMEFLDMDETSIASIVLFGVHSTVMGLHNKKITGDLAGYTSRYLENQIGNGHVSLFLSTGGGDQSPTVRTQDAPFIDDPQTGPEAFGNRLGSQIFPAFESGHFLNEISIVTDTIAVTLQREASGTTDIRPLYGIKYTDEFVMISTPFELFSSTVQELKQISPFEHTFILSLTNGVAHYIPPLETYSTGHVCYENETSIFTPSAEASFTEKCIQLLDDLNQK